MSGFHPFLLVKAMMKLVKRVGFSNSPTVLAHGYPYVAMAPDEGLIVHNIYIYIYTPEI